MTKANNSTNHAADPSFALWRIVVSEYESALAQLDRNWAAYEAADDASAEERKKLHAAHFKFVHEVFDPVRYRLLATPAPDFAALIVKTEVLAMLDDEGEGVRDDLKRLLSEAA